MAWQAAAWRSNSENNENIKMAKNGGGRRRRKRGSGMAAAAKIGDNK